MSIELSQNEIDTFINQLQLNNTNSLSSSVSSNNCQCNEISITNDGYEVCAECGKEFGGVINVGAEWRNFESSDVDNTRCGHFINPMLVESSYSITVSNSGRGHNLISMLSKWISVPPHERSLKIVFDKLTEIGVQNGIPLNIIEHSQVLFYNMSANIHRGENREGLIASCLYYACQEFGLSHSGNEIAKMFSISESCMTKGLKIFKKNNSGYSIPNDPNNNNYSHFIQRYCNFLNIEPDMEKQIQSICNKIVSHSLLDKNTPQTIACVSIYFVIISSTPSSLNISLNDISLKCNVSSPTILKLYNKLKKHIELLLD